MCFIEIVLDSLCIANKNLFQGDHSKQVGVRREVHTSSRWREGECRKNVQWHLFKTDSKNEMHSFNFLKVFVYLFRLLSFLIPAIHCWAFKLTGTIQSLISFSFKRNEKCFSSVPPHFQYLKEMELLTNHKPFIHCWLVGLFLSSTEEGAVMKSMLWLFQESPPPNPRRCLFRQCMWLPGAISGVC